MNEPADAFTIDWPQPYRPQFTPICRRCLRCGVADAEATHVCLPLEHLGIKVP